MDANAATALSDLSGTTLYCKDFARTNPRTLYLKTPRTILRILPFERWEYLHRDFERLSKEMIFKSISYLQMSRLGDFALEAAAKLLSAKEEIKLLPDFNDASAVKQLLYYRFLLLFALWNQVFTKRCFTVS